MKKNKKIHFSILENILLKDGYITTQELAKIIGVSAKTITNYMDKVHQLCDEYNLQLLSKKSKGYIIEEDTYLKQSIANSIKHTDTLPHFKEERRLFLLHILLTAKEPLKISYLEYHLHISRPSVYKCLDDIDNWLKNYKLVLHKKNYCGVFIEKGEKRRRLAIIDWYLETEKFLDTMKKNINYSDVLNLQKSFDFYNSNFDDVLVKNTVDEIQSLIGFKCIKDYSEKLQIILKISLLRISENNLIMLPEKRKTWVSSLDLNNSIPKIKLLIHKNFNVEITDEEASYFFSLILAGDTSHKKEVIKISSVNNINFEKLTCDLDSYLNENFLLSESIKTNFLNDIRREIETILTYQIGYEPAYSSEFSIIKSKYPIMFNYALNMFSIIQCYSNIFYSEKFITNVTYLLSNLVFQEKQPLKAVFIHNCNITELNFILSKLKRYLVEVDIIDILEFSESDSTLNYKNYDLILTTVDFEFDNKIKTIKLNRPLSYYDIIYYNSTVHDYYENINQKNILLKKV